jgi:hypothetical protein
MIAKRKDSAFNKVIYLLGVTSDGRNAWLEAPSWDCDHYWGFGYVEIYTNNNNPIQSRDIESHQHIDSSVMGDNNGKNGSYCHNPYDSKFFADTTFNEKEGWELGELFKTFYLLKDYADLLDWGTVGISGSEVVGYLENKEAAAVINKEKIPMITARILNILTPKE